MIYIFAIISQRRFMEQGFDFLRWILGFHAWLGEIGGILFLWVWIELFNKTPEALRRAKLAAFLAVIAEFLSWGCAAAYYLTHYPGVRDVIKKGAMPWAHTVILETKEHVFMFIPILALAAYFVIVWLMKNEDEKVRGALKWLSALILIMCFAMAGMGYIVSMTARLTIGGGL